MVCSFSVLQKEWLCLNCQTQRALSGQLGDMPPPPSPSKLPAKSQPTPPSSPARAVSSTPSSPAPTATATPAKGLKRTPSVTQAPEDKPELVSATADVKPLVESAEVKGSEAQAVLESTQVVPESSKEQTPHNAADNIDSISSPAEQIVTAPPPDSVPGETADVKEADTDQASIAEQTEPPAEDQREEKSEQVQYEGVEADVSESSNIANRNIKPTTDRETNQEASQGSEEVSVPEHLANECSAEPASADSIQTSVGNQADDKNSLATPNEVGEKEIITEDSAVTTSTMEKSVEPEIPTHSDEAVSCKDEVENEVMPHIGGEAKAVTEPLSAQAFENADSVKRAFVEENNLPNVEKDAVQQSKDALSTEEAQLLLSETPEGSTPASSAPAILTEHASVEIMTTGEVSGSANENLSKETEDASVMDEVKEAELVPQIAESSSSNTEAESEVVREPNANKEKEDGSLKDKLEMIKEENTENQPGPIGKKREAQTETPADNKLEFSEKAKEESIVSTKKETRQVAETTEKHNSAARNNNDESAPDPTIPEPEITLDKDIKEKTISQAELAPLAQETAPRQDKALLENVQQVQQLSNETARKTDYLEYKQIPEKAERTDRDTETGKSTEHLHDVADKKGGKHETEKGFTDSLSQEKSEQMFLSSAVSEAKYMENVSEEKAVKSDTDTVKTECVVEKDDSLSAISAQNVPKDSENSSHKDREIKQNPNPVSKDVPEQFTIPTVPLDEKVGETPLHSFDGREDIISEKEVKISREQPVVLSEKVNSNAEMSSKESDAVKNEQELKSDPEATKINLDAQKKSIFHTLDPAVDLAPPLPVASMQEINKSSVEAPSPDIQEKAEDEPKPLIKPKELDELGEVTVCIVSSCRESAR